MKIVDKKDTQTKQEPTTKIPYDKLEQLANQLAQQNKELRQQLAMVNDVGTYKRIDYLFEVLKSKRFPQEFEETCVEELTMILTIPEEVIQEEEK